MYQIGVRPPFNPDSVGLNDKGAWSADKIQKELNAGRKDWSGFDLRKGDFSNRDLRDCCFNCSLMDGVKLDGSELGGCSFYSTKLVGASLVGVKTDENWPTDFSYAHLIEAKLQGANLSCCNFEGATLRAALLNNAILVACKFVGADLRGAQCEGANFTAANLEGAHLWEALLKGANLRLAHCPGCNFTTACLESTHFEQANLKGAKLVIGQEFAGGRLSTPILSEAEMDDTTQLFFGGQFDLPREWTTSDTTVKGSIETIPHPEMWQKFVELYDGHRQQHQKAQDDFLSAKAFDDVVTKYEDILSLKTRAARVMALKEMPSLDLVEMEKYGIPLIKDILAVVEAVFRMHGLQPELLSVDLRSLGEFFQASDAKLNDKGGLILDIPARASELVAQWIERLSEPKHLQAVKEMRLDYLCSTRFVEVLACCAPRALGARLNWSETEITLFANMSEKARGDWAREVTTKDDLVDACPGTDFHYDRLSPNKAMLILKKGVQTDVLNLIRMAVGVRTGFTTDEMKAVLHRVNFATHPEHFIMALTGMDEKTFRQTGAYKELKAAMRPEDKEEALSTFIAEELTEEKNAAWQDRFFKHLSIATTEQKAVVCASLINGHNSQLYENDGFVKSLAIPGEEKKTFSASLKKRVPSGVWGQFKNRRLAGVNDRLSREFGALG
jgi:uncharacterized protein YjbI with pentapeptide repeats